MELTAVESRTLISQKIKNVIKGPCERILFVYPMNILEEDFSLKKALSARYWAYYPYGPGILSKKLQERGYQADIIDLNLEVLSAAHRLKENFSYSVWKEKLIERLKLFKPDVIGISCMFTMSHQAVKEIAALVKRHDPSLPILGGGVHLSNARKLVLPDCNDLDFIGIWECDKSLPDLFDFVNGKLSEDSLSQIATLIDGSYVALENRATPSVDEVETSPVFYDLPIGEYDKLGQIGTYGFLRHGRKAGILLTERGCRYHCSFCSVASFNGPGVRERSVKKVIDEIQDIHETYGVRHIELLDDDFLSKKQRVLDLLNELVRRNLDITWSASNGLVAACITPEIMHAMSDSGCIGFNLGIESGNDEMLKAVHKPGLSRNFRKAKEIIDKYPHIFVKGFLIIGFLNETYRKLLDTVNLAVELCFDWYPIQALNPLPSTEVYDYMLEEKMIEDSIRSATGDLAYVFGPHSKLHAREEREIIDASDFADIFENRNLDSMPTKEEMEDLRFLVGYKINYEKIINITDPIKLKKISAMLADTKDRVAPEGPLAHLFYGIIEKKLGFDGSANEAGRVARSLVEKSAFWRKRFEVLKIYPLLNSIS